jgi:iron complex transport system permease protein
MFMQGVCSPRRVIAGLCVVVPLLGVCALALGRYAVPLRALGAILLGQVLPRGKSGALFPWTAQMENVVINIRLPRICAAFLTGGALSLSGAVYQSMFRNPLVSPDLLGVASGASVGAASAILLHAEAPVVQLFALAGGLVAVLAATAIPRLFRNRSALMLVLAGVVVSGFMNAMLGALSYIADPERELAAIVYWTMGSLASVHRQNLLLFAPGIGVAGAVVLLLRWRINLLTLPDAEAHSLGVNIRLMRLLLIVCSTTLTALSICIAGTIGWIGLVVPHLGRLLAGNDHRYLLPTAVLSGGGFMIVVDTLARNITPSEVPLSILTGLLGTPLFVWLLLVRRAKIE